jgi:biopolymer transport protein ExbD
MAITAGQSHGADEDDLIATINTTPLVDVMLVLLIIFLITIPVVTHNIAVNLPKQTSQPNQAPRETMHVSVDQEGHIYLEQTRLTVAELQQKLLEAAHKTPQPEVHVRGDKRSSYEPIGRIVLACQRAGITRVGFITEPPIHP